MREREEGKRRFKKRRQPEPDEGIPVVGSSPEEAGRQVFPPVTGTPAAQPGWPPPTADATQETPAEAAPVPVPAPAGIEPAINLPPTAAPPPAPPLAHEPPVIVPSAPEPPPLPSEPPATEPPPPPPVREPEIAVPAAGEKAIPEPPRQDQARPGKEPAPPPIEQPPQQIPPGAIPPQGYMYPPPPWYPMPYMPPGFPIPYQPAGHYYGAPHPGMPADQTGQVPVMTPPGVPPMAGPPMPPMPGVPPPPGFQPVPPEQLQPFEAEEFAELSSPAPGHWRGDLKWIFGIITTLFLFLTLAAAGAYRATAPGAAKEVLIPLIESATGAEEAVKDNYQQLRSRARRVPSGSIVIPDLGMTVSVKASQVTSLSSEELADVVIIEIERQMYSEGYSGNLPMDAARGTGEERAKAISATLLTEINKQNHDSLLWVLIISGVLTLAFAVPFVLFCRGWGRVTGSAIVIIAAALPAALSVRIASEFIWKPGSGGPYKSAMYQALRSLGSMTTVFFDAALALGALVLLAGIIGGILSRRSRDRVPPFVDLQRPDTAVVGGAGVEPGLEPAVEVSPEDEVVLEAFKDIAPPPE